MSADYCQMKNLSKLWHKYHKVKVFFFLKICNNKIKSSYSNNSSSRNSFLEVKSRVGYHNARRSGNFFTEVKLLSVWYDSTYVYRIVVDMERIEDRGVQRVLFGPLHSLLHSLIAHTLNFTSYSDKIVTGDTICWYCYIYSVLLLMMMLLLHNVTQYCASRILYSRRNWMRSATVLCILLHHQLLRRQQPKRHQLVDSTFIKTNLLNYLYNYLYKSMCRFGVKW